MKFLDGNLTNTNMFAAVCDLKSPKPPVKLYLRSRRGLNLPPKVEPWDAEDLQVISSTISGWGQFGFIDWFKAPQKAWSVGPQVPSILCCREVMVGGKAPHWFVENSDKYVIFFEKLPRVLPAEDQSGARFGMPVFRFASPFAVFAAEGDSTFGVDGGDLLDDLQRLNALVPDGLERINDLKLKTDIGRQISAKLIASLEFGVRKPSSK